MLPGSLDCYGLLPTIQSSSALGLVSFATATSPTLYYSSSFKSEVRL